MASETRIVNPPAVAPLRAQLTWWILILPLAMFVALLIHNFYLLDYTHVLSGALWTGADLFMGFILGPVLRRLDPPNRQAVIKYLVPRTLLYFPTVAFTTGTAGWFLATWAGMLADGNPLRPWIFVALVMVTIMAVQGLGVILPNNLRIYREMQHSNPDRDRIVRLNRINIILSGVQGVLQVAIILVMAHLTVS